MAFMIPVVTQEDFLMVTDTRGEGTDIPADVALSADMLARYHGTDETSDPAILDAVREFCDGDPASVEFSREKFWSRLSAPGYLDATEWLGPFDTEDEARNALAETFDVCSECGEDLDTDEGNLCSKCKE